jgi:Fic family protein
MLPDKYRHCTVPEFLKHKHKDGFHPAIKAPSDIITRLEEIKSLDYEFSRFILSPEHAVDLINEAMASNIHFSTEIEGNPLSLAEVRRISRRTLEGKPPRAKNPGQQEIANHLLAWVNPEGFRLPWNAESIRALHYSLLEGVDDDANPGFFTTEGAQIEEEGEVVFRGAPPEDVEPQLNQLLGWLNAQGPAYSPVVAATVFFHEFESIHPFDDGNGRVGRTLFHMYLQTNGLPNSKLCFIEKHLLGSKQLYYTLLAWTDSVGSYSELLDYASDAILTAYQEAEKRLRKLDLLSSGLDEVSTRLLVRAKEHGGPFKLAEAVPWVEVRSPDTVRRRLNEMVKKEILGSQGATQSKRYWYRDLVVEAVERVRREKGEGDAADPHHGDEDIGPPRAP